MREQLGSVMWVLHAHMPYMRQVGPWPRGEESLHQATIEAYIPLIVTLSELAHAGLIVRIGLAASPVLLEQLADQVVQKHALLYIDDRLDRARADIARWERQGVQHFAYLARFYSEWLERSLALFDQRLGRNIVAALRGLVDRGIIEPVAGTATHTFLPALTGTGLARAQVQVGNTTTLWRLGQPTALWVPELRSYPGLERHMRGVGLRATILDSPSSQFVGRPAWLSSDQQAVALLRDGRITQQVISATAGYPGDFLYREFYRRDPDSDLAYWRVTGYGVPQQEKALYDPYHALNRAHEHASHFVALVERQLHEARERLGAPGLLVAAFDAELFGHGWFEGATWLRLVLGMLAEHKGIELVTPSQALERFAPSGEITPRQDAPPWNGPELRPHWERLSAAAQRLSQIAAARPSADGHAERALNQAARELLLASSSDWPYLIATGRAPEYAAARLEAHLGRFKTLLHLAETLVLTAEQEEQLAEIEELDNPFPLLNYRIFAQEAA